MLGVTADGTKELVALEDGYRESKESWASVLRDPNGYDLAWGQVNELVTQIRGKGTLILAGRETFIGCERVSRKITSLGQHDLLEALSLQPPDPNDAKDWLRARHWSDGDIASADALFDRSSYALRPFRRFARARPVIRSRSSSR